MSTKKLTIPYPDDLPESMGKSDQEFENEVQFLVAATLYESGKISSGRAATIAKMDRKTFLKQLSSHRISVLNYSVDELEQELQEARNRADAAR